MYRMLVVLLLLSTFAQAGGRGGHNTTFDAAFFPGYTIKNLITNYGATCNGVANDGPALASWITDGLAQNPGKILLYIPPGSSCNFVSGNTGTFQFDGSPSTAGIQNSVIWAYGASAGTAYIGGAHFPTDTTHEALIVTVSAGASAVTAITAGDTSRFSVGDWVCVCGLSLQQNGYPPNMQFYEYKLITAISSPIITLDTPLINSYKSTWPVIDTNPTQGPAILYRMRPSWNLNAQIYGLTVGAANQMILAGRTISMFDVKLVSGANAAPSGIQTFTVNSSVVGSPEVDKEIELATFNRGSASVVTVQSPVQQIRFDNVTFTTSLNGTGTNTLINGGRIGTIAVGPTFFGHGNSLVTDGVTIDAAQPSQHFLPATNYSFSGGTFTVARTAPFFANAISLAVPGYTYFLGCSGSSIAVPVTNFTVTDVRGDMTNVYIDTNMPSLPGSPPLCSGVTPYTGIGAWQQESIKQLNSPVGSVSITGYAP